ncbi:MAG: tRNA uridine-5-carboxymethylaminomethyl(34) synthesis GTPase MnmE, partial [Thermoguttaceae bacterium]|nr:tRNA uridine-5-carboxymethylaminomethyl(34) synthesis GTPase MnmE [Thermoguttaceae bacterium]
AQIELLCLDASRPLTRWEQGLVAESAPTRIAVWTKADAAAGIPPAPPAIATSTVTGEGIAALRERIRAEAAAGSVGEVVAGTAARCRESLHRAAECFHRALALHDVAAGEELIAAEIRLALEELGKVTGAVYTDDVLDRIFSRFCIGK